MLFIDNIVLVDETRCGVNFKLEIWWDALKSKEIGEQKYVLS